MSELPTRAEVERSAIADWVIARAYINGDLLSREEAANKMVTFFDHYCDDSPNWPMRDDAMKWLEVTDDE